MVGTTPTIGAMMAPVAPARPAPGTARTQAAWPQTTGGQTAKAGGSPDAPETLKTQTQTREDLGADTPGGQPVPDALTLYDADQEAELW